MPRYRIVFRHPGREQAILVDTTMEERETGLDRYSGQPLRDGGTIVLEDAAWSVSRREWKDTDGLTFREYVCRPARALPSPAEGATI